MKYYVTMTDTFLSNWGMAEGKIAKFIHVCDTFAEAKIVYNNAKAKSDQKYVNITSKKPYYNTKRYHVEYKTKKDTPNWCVENYFVKS